MTKQNYGQGASGGMEPPKDTKKKPQQQQAENTGGTQQQGDDRTPDKIIGEVAYANRAPEKKKTGEF